MTVMKQLAWGTTEYVLMESTRRSIEKWAEEFAKKLREDPEWQREIREAAHEAALIIAGKIRAPRAHSGRKRSPRKTKRRRPGTRTSRTA